MDELLNSMEDAYANWEEAEQRHVHIMSVYAILDTLGDSEEDQTRARLPAKAVGTQPCVLFRPLCLLWGTIECEARF